MSSLTVKDSKVGGASDVPPTTVVGSSGASQQAPPPNEDAVPQDDGQYLTPHVVVALFSV